MDTHEALLTRRTAHLWTDDPVPDAVLQRALAAANMAPCHRFTWPWRFTLPSKAAQADLCELGTRLKAASKGLEITEGFRAKVRKKMLNPALVVVSQVRVDDAFQSEEDYAATACAIQNLCLSAHADGYFSKWSTGGVTRHPDTYQRLGIDPEAERIVGFIWVGTPVRPPSPPERPDVAGLIRRVD